MRKVFVVLLLASACAAVASAQRGGDAGSALRSMVESERAFSRASVERGISAAFVAFSADDGVIFRNTPLNSKKFWTERGQVPGVLTWQPAYADIARAGDLGYTFGPWEFRQKSLEDKPAGHGHFVTVWRRQPDGSWKFAADIGVSHPPLPTVPPLRLAPAPGGGPVSKSSAETERARLLKLENDFSADALARGATDAYRARLAPEARLFLQNAAPYEGRDAALAALGSRKAALVWEAAHAEVAGSADLGYTYGTYQLTFAGDGGKSERGHFMHIWKRQPGGPWRLVLDITNPIRQ